MESVEKLGLRRRTALRQHRQFAGMRFALQMRQNSLDNRRIFNASNDLDQLGPPLAGRETNGTIDIHLSQIANALSF
jgi:hypothetical protein